MPELRDRDREATEAEAAQLKFRTARHAEIEAMRKAFDALVDLDSDAKRRVMRWLDDGTLFPPRKYDDEPPF
jgi:hypothetical protein